MHETICNPIEQRSMSETNEAFAYIVDSNGNKVGLNAEELGRFVIENYAT